MWTPTSPAARSVPSNAVVDLRAKIPADVDAPDRVAFDLTFRQVAVLTVAAMAGSAVWILLSLAVPMVPGVVRAVALVPIAGVGLALAVGRRDGLPLEMWLAEAAVFKHRPRRRTPTPAEEPPTWAPPTGQPVSGPGRPPGLLRLPADAIDSDGVIRHGDRGGCAATVLVAATTVNITLRTPAEQAGLVAGLGRWLNGLTTPVQIVVSTRRVDLPSHALRLIDRIDDVDPTGAGARDDAGDRGPGGLAAAAADHAEFLLDLAEQLDPLARTVTIAATATGGPSPATVARRTGEHTVAALTALGAQAAVLDAPAVTAVLTAATDPYQAGDAGWARTPPGEVVTAHPALLTGGPW